jgi:hypothetical protein
MVSDKLLGTELEPGAMRRDRAWEMRLGNNDAGAAYPRYLERSGR